MLQLKVDSGGVRCDYVPGRLNNGPGQCDGRGGRGFHRVSVGVWFDAVGSADHDGAAEFGVDDGLGVGFVVVGDVAEPRFANAAQLAELDVKVGDVVKPGQLLAREDPFQYQQALNQQRALLAQQQALLNKSTRDVSVPDAQRAVDAAQQTYQKNKDVTDAQRDVDRNNTNRTRVSEDFADRQVDAVLRQIRNNNGMCPGSTPSTPDPTASTNSGALNSIGNALRGGSGGSSGRVTQRELYQCPAYVSAKQSQIQAKTAYQQAQRTEDLDESKNDVSTASAKSMLVSAQNTLNEAATDRPSNIAAQAAVVANQASLVAKSQRDLNDTSLFAPVGGTVSAITGTVGEYMAAANSGTTSLAPGSDAAIPGVGAAATSDQAGNASSGISATKPGGGFIVLNNINTFQVVVPFEESDAAKVAPNQKVNVTFDAIPDLQREGTVLSIAPNGVNISGVTNYYATILLTQTDPRLKDGQTAEASVITNSLDNVLVVPNSAVIKSGGNSYVNTPGPDGKPRQTQFTPGAVGDDNTQVLGGLSEGQQILLTQGGAGGGAGGAGRGAGNGNGGGGGGGGGH